MKKIVRVMVFYDDGTFEECNAASPQPTLTFPPGVRTPDPIMPRAPFTPAHRCMLCGEQRTGSCGKLECPNGYTNPWDNSTKVTD
jgi:hypothetical protein